MSQCRAHIHGANDPVPVRCMGQALHDSLHEWRSGDWVRFWHEELAIYPHEPVDQAEPEHDQVKAPSHYRFPNGTEVKDITAWLSFWRGSAVKYICRAGRKTGVDELTDLRKARECIDNEIQRLEAAQ